MTVVENYSPLAQELNRLAGITDILEYQDEQGAANVWANTSGLGVLAALNQQVDETRSPAQYKGLNDVCNELAGTTGLEAIPALSTIPSAAEYLLTNKAAYYIDSTDASASTQTVTNLGNAGSLLPTTVGSATTADSNDPIYLDHTGTNYVYLPGVTGNFLSVPDEAALDITGDIDLRAYVALDDWTPATLSRIISKRLATTDVAYSLSVNTTGTLLLNWSTDGTTVIVATSTVAPTITDGQPLWVRATLDVDNGASGYDVKFFTSDNGTTWTQLGTTVTGVGTTSIFNSTQQFQLGMQSNNVSPGTGKYYRAQVLDGIDGTTVLDVDTSVITTGAADSFTAVTGQTVTINRSTSGRKTVAVTQPVWLFGTDDYMEVNNRYLTHTGSNYLYLPGVASNRPSTPDAAALDITGDIDLRCKVALDDWTPAAGTALISKYFASGNQRSYQLEVRTTGILRLNWSTDGTNELTADSTVAPTVTDGSTLWVRATLDVDDGSSGNEVNFFTSTDGTNWTQLGTTVTQAGTTSIFNSNTTLNIGATPGGASPARGKFFRAQVLDGIDGTVAFDADFETSITSLLQADFTESSVNAATVTINRSGDGFESAGITEAGYLYPGATNTFTASDLDHLNFGAADSFSVVFVSRQPNYSGTSALIYKMENSTTGPGYYMRNATSVPSTLVFAVADSTTLRQPTATERVNGTLHTATLIRNVATDVVVGYLGDTLTESVSDTTTGTISNFLPLRVGRVSGTGTTYGNFELYAAAVFRKALTAREVKIISDYFTTKVGA